MTGFPISGTVGLLITLGVVCVLIVVVSLMVRRMAKEQVEWEPMNAATIRFSVSGAKGNLALKLKLIRCVDESVRSLEEFSIWPGLVRQKLFGVRIFVMPVATYRSGSRTVAGEAAPEFFSVIVGSDLAALCHEFGHLLERAATGSSDPEHKLWPTNGLTSADDDYLTWLRSS